MASACHAVSLVPSIQLAPNVKQINANDVLLRAKGSKVLLKSLDVENYSHEYVINMCTHLRYKKQWVDVC